LFNLREEEVQQLRNASFPRFSWVFIALQLAFRFPFPFPFSWVLFLWLLWLLFLLVSFRFIGAAFGLFVAIFSSRFFFSFSLFIYDIYTEQTQQRHNNCSICDMVSLSLARLSAERVFLSGYCWRHSFVYILYIISLFFFADKVA